FVNMRKNAEMQIRILIKDLSLGIRSWTKVLGDELGIGASAFGVLAHQLAAGGAPIFEQGCPAIGRELLKRIGHDHLPSLVSSMWAAQALLQMIGLISDYPNLSALASGSAGRSRLGRVSSRDPTSTSLRQCGVSLSVSVADAAQRSRRRPHLRACPAPSRRPKK